MPHSRLRYFHKFKVSGIRCVVVDDDGTLIAYVNVGDAPDILFTPITYRGGLPEILEGQVQDQGQWSGWVYPEEVPFGVEEAKRQCAIVAKAALKG